MQPYDRTKLMVSLLFIVRTVEKISSISGILEGNESYSQSVALCLYIIDMGFNMEKTVFCVCNKYNVWQVLPFHCIYTFLLEDYLEVGLNFLFFKQKNKYALFQTLNINGQSFMHFLLIISLCVITNLGS